jgi:hypothetical protein
LLQAAPYFLPALAGERFGSGFGLAPSAFPVMVMTGEVAVPLKLTRVIDGPAVGVPAWAKVPGSPADATNATPAAIELSRVHRIDPLIVGTFLP